MALLNYLGTKHLNFRHEMIVPGGINRENMVCKIDTYVFTTVSYQMYVATYIRFVATTSVLYYRNN